MPKTVPLLSVVNQFSVWYCNHDTKLLLKAVSNTSNAYQKHSLKTAETLLANSTLNRFSGVQFKIKFFHRSLNCQFPHSASMHYEKNVRRHAKCGVTRFREIFPNRKHRFVKTNESVIDTPAISSIPLLRRRLRRGTGTEAQAGQLVSDCTKTIENLIRNITHQLTVTGSKQNYKTIMWTAIQYSSEGSKFIVHSSRFAFCSPSWLLTFAY